MRQADHALYAAFFNSSPEMLCVTGRDGRFTLLNKACAKVLGFTRDEMHGRSLLDFIHPEDKAAAARKKLGNSKGPVSFEARCLCKDGSHRWLLWHCAAQDAKGLCHAVAVDITARKMTEAALRENAEALRRILDLAPMPMAIVAAGGAIEYLNRKATDTFGYTRADIPDLDRAWALMYPDQKSRAKARKGWEAKVRKAFRERTEIEGAEYPITCKNGTIKTVFVMGVTSANRLFLLFDDITRRVETEKELRENESRYRALVETTRTGYVIVSKEGRVLDANTEYVRLTGRRDLKEILGKSVLEWTAAHEKAKNTAALNRCAREGHIKDFEVDYADGSGNITPVEINASVVSRGGSTQILTLCRDITARRRAEAEIRGLNQDLEQRVRERTEELTSANKDLLAEISQRMEAERSKDALREQLLQSQKLEAVGQLAGGIAHDFNNILVSISGYAELLLDTAPADAPARADLSEILLETERGAALTRQLLTFSKKQEIHLELVNMNRAVIACEKMLKRIIGTNVHLETRLAPQLHQVRADPSQLSQIIINLVINARDAMPEGGRIIMETRNTELGAPSAKMRLAPPPGLYAELSVGDTGLGMTPEILKHLFEPFYTTKKPGQGTGLGLPTIYGIVSHAGGGIYIDSEPGHGTTIKIYFPRAD